MHDMSDMVNDFLVESFENLDQLDRDLLVLEHEPSSQPTLASVFRTIHSIKGACGFLGFSKLESLAHLGESLLVKLREGELALNADITSGLLAEVDAIRQMLHTIEQTGQEGACDFGPLRSRLTQLQQPSESSPAPSTLLAASDSPAPASETAAPAEVTTNDAEPDVADPGRLGAASRLAERTIRVEVDLLDKLMNRVGELVLARNQILQFANSPDPNAFLSTCQRLNLITTELQEGVMKTRMQPICTVWNKFPRIVRDLAIHCGKQVRIEMRGKETDLDKTIVEAIKDPLTHLVRNAIDHGIEPPERRAAAGKPVEGRLLLQAFHEGGKVNIEISDDGDGLNLPRIKQKAVDRGLISVEQAGRMSDRELSQLIFRPGFSTAESLTNVSGRGVGMDVVKTNIEKIGGAVDVQSVPGRGTTIKIKIPLTLAIIPALIVTSGGERYAIPQVSLLELLRLEGEQARRGIERLHDAPILRLRGQILPLVYLNRLLRLSATPCGDPPNGETPITDARPGGSDRDDGDDVVKIVVLRADDRQFGLVVDAINDTEEIVVKPLAKQLKRVTAFAGATIMGDGQIALILDVLGVAQMARVVSEVRDRNLRDMQCEEERRSNNGRMLLLVEVGDNRLALPISSVARLEKIDPAMIEVSDHREVVQYRGRIMPLVRLAQVLDMPSSVADGELLPVVVFPYDGRSVGLVVDRIVDTVPDTGDMQPHGRTPGVVGSAVIDGRITDLIDPPTILRRGGVLDDALCIH